MVYEFLRFVEETEPTYFIMENVSGLKGAANGDLLRDILARMDKLGYNVNHGILSAADFGAAQLRRRIFCIGVRKPFPKVPMPEPTHGQADGFLQVKPHTGVGEAFAGLPKILESRNSNYPPATIFANGEGNGALQDAAFVLPVRTSRQVSYKDEKRKTSCVKKRGLR
jgi:site-specific DNA-cytosine methylase